MADFDSLLAELGRALAGRRALLIIDNLETLNDAERRRVFDLLAVLPQDCRALVTSRRSGGARAVERPREAHWRQTVDPDNDPLAFMFGDLVETFSDAETAVLASLARLHRARPPRPAAAADGAEPDRRRDGAGRPARPRPARHRPGRALLAAAAAGRALSAPGAA